MLGSWVNPSSARSILDVGTGCGILALIMAWKSEADIEAIDLDLASVKEAEQNFFNSCFHRRLNVYQDDFVAMAERNERNYDLIISNPPFFTNNFPSSTKQKFHARHTESLSYAKLADGSLRLLKEDGELFLVLPYDESRVFIETANTRGLYLQKKMIIFPFRGHQPNRINLKFGLHQVGQVETEMFIIREEGGDFSEQYRRYLGKLILGIVE